MPPRFLEYQYDPNAQKWTGLLDTEEDGQYALGYTIQEPENLYTPHEPYSVV